MIKLRKIEVGTLHDALNLFPASYITSGGDLVLYDKYEKGKANKSAGIVSREHFGKTFLVDVRDDAYLVIAEYQINKLKYGTSKMEYVPTVICIIHKEWELQE